MSKLIGRELADAIDELIKIRIHEHSAAEHGSDWPVSADDSEVVIRQITDALLAMDARPGIYVK